MADETEKVNLIPSHDGGLELQIAPPVINLEDDGEDEDDDHQILDDDEDDPKKKVDDDEDDEDDDEKAQYSKKVDRRIKKLTRNYRTEQRRRLEAEEETAELRDRIERLEAHAEESGEADYRRQAEDLKVELAAAIEEGDTAKQVEIHGKMAKIAGAEMLIGLRKRRKRADDGDDDQGEPQGRKRAAHAQEDPPPLAIRWYKRHQNWFNNPEYGAESAMAKAIDLQLTQEGYDQDDPEYYAELDDRLKNHYPDLYLDEDDDEDEPARRRRPKRQRRERSPVATGKRTSGRRKRKSGRLTRDELEMASALGLTSEEQLKAYAEELGAL